MESELHPPAVCGLLLGEGRNEGRKGQESCYLETERFFQGVERCVLQGQMGMSRTQNGQNIPGKGSRPESESLISPFDSVGPRSYEKTRAWTLSFC